MNNHKTYKDGINDMIHELSKRSIKVTTVKAPHIYMKAVGTNHIEDCGQKLKKKERQEVEKRMSNLDKAKEDLIKDILEMGIYSTARIIKLLSEDNDSIDKCSCCIYSKDGTTPRLCNNNCIGGIKKYLSQPCEDKKRSDL